VCHAHGGGGENKGGGGENKGRSFASHTHAHLKLRGHLHVWPNLQEEELEGSPHTGVNKAVRITRAQQP